MFKIRIGYDLITTGVMIFLTAKNEIKAVVFTIYGVVTLCQIITSIA